LKYVGFYWTLPIRSVGFISLSDDPEIASQQSRTIAYQREVIKKYAADEGSLVVGEIPFLEVTPDRGSKSVEHYIKKAATLCRQLNATLLFVDFREAFGWRPHGHMVRAIEAEGVLNIPVWPSHDTMIINGQPFHPAEHFKDHRMQREIEAAQRRDIAIARLAIEAAQFTSRGRHAVIADRLNAEGVETFQGGRPWTPDNVKKALARLNLKSDNGNLQSPALKSQANNGLLDGI
jgi:hypothetical protein